MQQNAIEIDESKLPSHIQLMCELIDDLLIPVDITDVAKAHAAISAPLFEDETGPEESGIDLGFLADSPSWALGGAHVPDLQPLKTRAYEDYMGKLHLNSGAMNDHIMILYSLSDGSYHVKCLKCGAVFQADNKMFHSGLCPVHQNGYRWVSVNEIGLDLSGHYSSGATVIPKTRTYAPK